MTIWDGLPWLLSLLTGVTMWLAGSKDAFAQKLNYAFQNNLVDYSNEPAFLAVYAFIYARRPDLASYWARKLMVTSYSLTGYPGNDDSGAMSSWYVFNTLGLFPNAGQDTADGRRPLPIS